MTMLLRELVDASAQVGATASRLEKTARLAELLRRAGPHASSAAAWLTGDARVRTSLGPAAVRAAWDAPTAAEPTLTIAEVADELATIAGLSGAGSTTARVQRLRDLFARATADEREFLAGLVLGELRQGALAGVMADAIARAADVPAADVRRALLLTGDLPTVAAAALDGGVAALRGFGVQLFRPLAPMLAQPAQDVDAALARLHNAAFDYKLDGARVQVHRRGDEVRVYSRLLNEVTGAAPELVEAVRALPGRELVLDGEAIVLRPNGVPEPFQVTMRRFGRRLDVARLRAELPLATFFFDVLYVDGESLLERPALERFAALRDVVHAGLHVPRMVTADPAAAAGFMAAARAAGHEGLVAKSLDAPYDAGRRGGGWLKLKQADTLDLVVLAAEWGHGRRQGWLSNLHLGARDPERGSFVMLGKTFKGLTDALLEWQTRELLAREIGREGHVVHVRPELVVEVAFEGVQTSSRYPGGVALRFARVRRYRDDKTAAEADTLARVLASREMTTPG
ncbi:MAG TPA: ATP-dependent DNA ligase [Longimicrobiales bacterium]|nr:ATP-dependent DNA ligase [Longimicrobiales bacterium]